MSWYKKIDNMAGMEMSVEYIEDVKYKDLIRIFGKPNSKIEKFDGGEIHHVEWKLDFKNVPFKIVVDSSDWAMKNWERKKYKIPDVREDFIDEIEVIGKREFTKSIIKPILHSLTNQTVSSEDLQFVIKYIFTN